MNSPTHGCIAFCSCLLNGIVGHNERYAAGMCFLSGPTYHTVDALWSGFWVQICSAGKQRQSPQDFRKHEFALIRTQQKSKFQMKLRSIPGREQRGSCATLSFGCCGACGSRDPPAPGGSRALEAHDSRCWLRQRPG